MARKHRTRKQKRRLRKEGRWKPTKRQTVEERKRTLRRYLKTQAWQNLRWAVLKRDGYKCANCWAADTILDVHHKTYERLGAERLSDLITLCRDCHTLLHESGRDGLVAKLDILAFRDGANEARKRIAV